MKRIYLIVIVVLILVTGFLIFRAGGEDSWIKDEHGVWIKHGNPSETPGYVLEQQQIISEALELYNKKKSEGMEFSSQCLGLVRDYAVDIVHIPRTQEDNLVENQCEDYRKGYADHFIELDKEGEIVRIV